MKNHIKTAFSLIELSIVILIVGIIIAGITQSSRLVELYRISSAKTQTQSSLLIQSQVWLLGTKQLWMKVF